MGELAARLRAEYRIRPPDALQISACLLRGAIGILELAEDLGLPHDEGIEAGGDPERVAHARGVVHRDARDVTRGEQRA